MKEHTCKTCGSILHDPSSDEFACLTNTSRTHQWNIAKLGFENIIELIEKEKTVPASKAKAIHDYVGAQYRLIGEILNDSKQIQ